MWILLAASAQAAFWDRPLKTGYTVGLNLVMTLGPSVDRARFGLAVQGQYQRFWADSPYSATESVLKPAPLLTLDARLGWTHPVVFVEATGLAGPMLPRVVADRGFKPLVGAQVGGGLQLGTDGSAGPVLTGVFLGPSSEVRAEVVHWQGWHAPRIMVGPTFSLNCCLYLL